MISREQNEEGDRDGWDGRDGFDHFPGRPPVGDDDQVPSHAESWIWLTRNVLRATGLLCFFPIQKSRKIDHLFGREHCLTKSTSI